MATERANDLQAFKSFIDEQLAGRDIIPTVDEVIARWEHENESDEEREETLEAISEQPIVLACYQRGAPEYDGGTKVLSSQTNPWPL